MCKGLGRLERFILQRASEPPVCFHCQVLAADVAASPKAMARALHSFVRKFPQYALQGGSGRHRALVLYDPADKVSERWAFMSVNSRHPVTKEQALRSLEPIQFQTQAL